MWIKQCVTDPRYHYSITSNLYVVEITGGSITIKDRGTGNILKRYSGHKYLYTGDISPDETHCFALENGKHFYVYSLKDYELVKKVTLPRGYEAIDVYGYYSEDGKELCIPAQRWVAIRGHEEGYHEHVICRYETVQYSFADKVPDEAHRAHGWVQAEEDPQEDAAEAEAFLAQLNLISESLAAHAGDRAFMDRLLGIGPKQSEPDPDADDIMKIIFGDEYKK